MKSQKYCSNDVVNSAIELTNWYCYKLNVIKIPHIYYKNVKTNKKKQTNNNTKIIFIVLNLAKKYRCMAKQCKIEQKFPDAVFLLQKFW